MRRGRLGEGGDLVQWVHGRVVVDGTLRAGMVYGATSDGIGGIGLGGLDSIGLDWICLDGIGLDRTGLWSGIESRGGLAHVTMSWLCKIFKEKK